jgi:hypothetical protein
MANNVIFDSNGNVAGFESAPGDDGVVNAVTVINTIADNTPKEPTVEAASTVTDQDRRINSSLKYPIKPLNNHFVRFFINLDEESSLITQKNVSFTDRPVDYQDQNRTNTGSVETVNANAKAASIVLGGMTAAAAAKHLFAGKYQAVAAGVGGAVGAAGTAAFGNTITETLKLSKEIGVVHNSICASINFNESLCQL